jgi:hypothetical protein
MTESNQTKNTRELRGEVRHFIRQDTMAYEVEKTTDELMHIISAHCNNLLAQTKQETIQACKDALPKEGIIVAPENVGTSESPVLYKETLARNKTIAAAHKALDKLGDNL